ncbi:MAG: hypothetical protein A2X46_08120 [Lentisphaerae bacterium GWF2_57_35]|nr:MAG: hypothetical protein A2X46_08120 [Lentisphaerae bacterium GWF2_57_35]
MNKINGQELHAFSQDSISAARKGDPEALAQLFEHYDPLIRAIPAWKKWNFSPILQEDLCQSIRLQVQRILPRLDANSSLEFFIKSICIHRCIDEVRRQIKTRTLMTPLIQEYDEGRENRSEAMMKAGNDPSPATLLDLGERSNALQRALGSMDESCRTTVTMFYFDGLSYKEIASRLGISVMTVGTRLSRCLNKLRLVLAKDKVFQKIETYSTQSTN